MSAKRYSNPNFHPRNGNLPSQRQQSNFRASPPRSSTQSYTNRTPSSYGGSDPSSHQTSSRGGFRPPPSQPISNPSFSSDTNPSASLPSFKKDFYKESPTVSRRSEAEISQYREKIQISIFGKDIPKPITSFDEINLPREILSIFKEAGFANPTPIQCQSWPVALSGRDLIGIAKTGSGKTVSYALPGIIHILGQQSIQPGEGPIVLILSPTRELAVQISQECSRLGSPYQINNICIYGGSSRSYQQRGLRNCPPIAIATPGRLLDFLESDVTNLKRVTFLVIDEADRMLDMGFGPQIRKIISQIRPDRQTLMWSATWPREVQNLANEFIFNPIHIQVGSLNLSANHDIKQIIEFINEEQKLALILTILRDIMDQNCKVLVFCETKKGCETLATDLKRQNYEAESIHGDKMQRERDQVLRDFRNNKISIMVATDVAARGLDIKEVNFVINFDFPNAIEDYVHRIGRTARAGTKGTAISFFTRRNMKSAQDLMRILKESKQEIPSKLAEITSNDRRRDRSTSRGRQNRNNFRSRSPRRGYNKR
ncbi:unnamed protein product [Blepharisma stoltei]|uniref:RNA helicase n=1 Tax=Blepharisma stoltei TaxID=1481888 RepID=A0AAU9K6V2_9CILI|nr:unnamed protein product [Blepharisma stoltei]